MLERALRVDGRALITQAITGLGGVGKTQLAARYVHTHGDKYDIVAWIHAEDGGIADLATLAAKFDERVEGLSPAEQRDLALERLARGEERWLLVLDNIDSPEQLPVCLPQAGNGRVLVTSRNGPWGTTERKVTLSGWPARRCLRTLGRGQTTNSRFPCKLR